MADIKDVRIPDIGGFDDVDIVEVLVSPGDRVEKEQSLITLESDKASMEVPSPVAGVVKEVLVAVGDQVSEGDAIASIEAEEGEAEEAEAPAAEAPAAEAPAAEAPAAEAPAAEAPAAEAKKAEPGSGEDGGGGDVSDSRASSPEKRPSRGRGRPGEKAYRPPPTVPSGDVDEGIESVHAGPGVRRFARELGVDLRQVEGTGRKGRILKEDVQEYVKEALRRPAGGVAEGAGIPPVPEVDFARFGPIERQPLTRINRATGRAMKRAWLNVPHVTQFDEADITELDDFRRSLKPEAERRGVKLTFLSFLLKAAAGALEAFPRFKSSLDPDGEHLVMKHYCHIGVAVDTEQGLVVPVLRDVNHKGIYDLAEELGDISDRARDGHLTPADLQGAVFSISSLGGIGGTQFTPIVNAPEVAILGVSRASRQPVWRDGGFQPRLILPFSLSYDHRVIDGAAGVRFTTHLADVLSDVRRLLL